jgi:hypothetical protein
VYGAAIVGLGRVRAGTRAPGHGRPPPCVRARGVSRTDFSRPTAFLKAEGLAGGEPLFPSRQRGADGRRSAVGRVRTWRVVKGASERARVRVLTLRESRSPAPVGAPAPAHPTSSATLGCGRSSARPGACPWPSSRPGGAGSGSGWPPPRRATTRPASRCGGARTEPGPRARGPPAPVPSGRSHRTPRRHLEWRPRRATEFPPAWHARLVIGERERVR